MKFWTDVNIPRPFKKALEQAGHEVFTAPERSSCEIALKKTLPQLDGSKLDMLDCRKERQETTKIKGEIVQ